MFPRIKHSVENIHRSHSILFIRLGQLAIPRRAELSFSYDTQKYSWHHGFSGGFVYLFSWA